MSPVSTAHRKISKKVHSHMNLVQRSTRNVQAGFDDSRNGWKDEKDERQQT